jgi:PPOX class probable F420-dependent enzyme
MNVMTRAEAVAFLAEGNRTGKLATASRVGVPHVAPVWFVVDGDDIVFTTGAQTLKGRNLTENPLAALTVDAVEFPHTFVVVRGPVSIDETLSELLAWATLIAERYVPAGRAEEYGRRNGVPGELLCRLHMQRIRAERDIAL